MNASGTKIRPMLVAKDVQVEVLAGRKPHIGKIAAKHGYSPSAVKAGKVQRTIAYKREMTSFMDRLEHHREAILKQMEATINQAGYNDASLGLDRTTKVHQLLTGGATENVAVKMAQLTDAELEKLVDGS